MTDKEEYYKKRRQLLVPAAFGAHINVKNKLKEFFEEVHGFPSFQFYELFLEEPFTKKQNLRNPKFQEQSTCAPFLARIVYDHGFFPKQRDNATLNDTATIENLLHAKKGLFEMVPLTDANMEELDDFDDFELKVQHTAILKYVIKMWKTQEDFVSRNKSLSEQRTSCFMKNKSIATIKTKFDVKELHAYPGNQVKKLKNKEKYGPRLREHVLVTMPWLLAPDTQKEISVLSVSISSQSTFWGLCNVLFPPISNEQLSDLRKIIGDYVSTLYVPLLTLLENYLYEEQCKESLEGNNVKLPGGWVTKKKQPLKNSGNIYLKLLAECHDQSDNWSKLNDLETALVELWADRLSHLYDSENGDEIKKRNSVIKSLVFSKYLVVSPEMLDWVKYAASLGHKYDQKNKKIKTSLVIGGPGSGKDSMAKLIRIFSPGYRFGRPLTLNMAMFRPKELAVPLLMGVRALHSMSRTGEQISEFSLSGILYQALNGSESENEQAITLIMDELNSLDIDTQGALLRVLENSELTPLGHITPEENIDMLLVGVMNENPQMIMKQRMIDRFLVEKELLGEVLSEVFYEAFRRQRRLRDDLYYRMIRGGEIRIPSLHKRREDIPLLFYFFIKHEFCGFFPKSVQEFKIDLPVYETLTDPALGWPGNIRELQSITRMVVSNASREYKEKQSTNRRLTIKSRHVRKALQSFKENGGG